MSDEVEALKQECKTLYALLGDSHGTISAFRAALKADSATLRLHLGEMTAQELRTLRAGFAWVLNTVSGSKRHE